MTPGEEHDMRLYDMQMETQERNHATGLWGKTLNLGKLADAILEAHAMPYQEIEDGEEEDDEYLREAPAMQG